VFKTIKEQIKYWNNTSSHSVGPIPPGGMSKKIRQIYPESLGRVLDFGCGHGRLYTALKPFDYYVGVDISHKFLTIFRNQYPLVPLVLIENFKIPLMSNDFDTVLCYSVFTHMHANHMDLILAEFRRVLKPNGRVLVSIFELEVVGAPTKHNWVMIERKKFLDLCAKHAFVVVGEGEIPDSQNYQTLFILEKKR